MNLSSHKLTAGQTQLLSRGLSFCPTPGQPELSSTQEDLDSFHRSLRLKHFFSELEDDNSETSQSNSQRVPSFFAPTRDEGFDNHKFHNKSRFNPKGPTALEAFVCSNDTHNYRALDYKRPKDNLSHDERVALKELKVLSSQVIIKPADKGSAVVLQNRQDYLEEGLRQLSDPHFYRKVPRDLSADHMQSIIDLVDHMRSKREISKKVHKYLLEFPMRTSRFYMLPKIHKGKFPPPGRPIISGNVCPTERISQFVDHFLKEVAPLGKSFLKDTTSFLQCIRDIDTVDPSCLLVTLDVTGLYTNIPNDEGIRAAEIAL